MNFKEFLKQKGHYTNHWHKTKKIAVTDLGNWAWNVLVFERDLSVDLLGDIFNDWGKLDLSDETACIETLLCQIVVACLGKQEIGKRLKELKSE